MTRVVVSLVLVVALAMVSIHPANGLFSLQLPAVVFVYNGVTDTFDNNAQGYIWQQLGLLDANGKPGTVQGNNVVDDNGNVLGGVIRDGGGNIIGYSNAAGTAEAYDVSAGATTAQAWNRVANNGMLHIVKHGAGYVDEHGGGHEGGGIQLDKGLIYDGFGAGTGVGYGNGPYNLPPRPGANITVNANGCWTSHDPDGAGPERSVTDSAAGVPGVGATQGHNGVVNANVQIQLAGGTPAQRQAAWQALQAAAGAAGFKDDKGSTGPNEVGSWLASLSFQDQYKAAQDAVDKAVPPPGTVRVRLNYFKQEVPLATQAVAADVGLGGYSIPPLLIRPSPLVGTTYDYGSAPVWARLYVPPDSLTAPTMFHLVQVGVPPAPLPANRVVNSSMMDFKTLGPTAPFSTSLEIALRYYDDSGPLAVYRYESPLGWQQVPTKTVDFVTHLITVEASSLSVYAVLMSVTPGVEIAPPTAAGSGYPGDAVTYTLTVTNTGDYSDTVVLTAHGVWSPTLSTYLAPALGPGLAASVTMTVLLPFTATAGMSCTVTVTATSTISPALSRASQVTTTARWRTLYLPLVLRM